MTEKSKRVDYEMKYIGWNIGATRVERHETKGDIELLELKIDGVDILKQLEKAENWDNFCGWTLGKCIDAINAVEKLEDAKKYLDTIVIPSQSDITNLKELLEAKEEEV